MCDFDFFNSELFLARLKRGTNLKGHDPRSTFKGLHDEIFIYADTEIPSDTEQG